MNILIVSTIFKPNTGGSASYFELLTNLMQRSTKFNKIFLLTEFSHGCPILEKIGKLRIIRILMPRDSYRLNSFLYKCISYIFVQVSFFILTIFLKRELHIIHMHSRSMNWFTNIHLKFLGVPTIIDVRDNYFNYKNLTSAQVLICAAENIYQNVKKKVICGDVRHIPIPLNYNILLKNSICNIRDSKTWRLLFAATITENKGIKELISAVKLLNKKNFKYTLVIVGKNLTKKKLLENLPEYIVYKGELEQYNLYDEMRNCDLFILPSKSEGMPRVCLEAIAMGKITLLPPNIPEFDKNCKDFVLDQINPKFIAQKIEIVMSSANRKITYPIENHFPENCFKRTIKAYNSAIKYKN